MEYPVDKIISYLKRNLDSGRFKHTMSVRKIALELAAVHGAPAGKAETAALLHDAGKAMSPRKMADYVKRRKLGLPRKAEVIGSAPALLHPYIGADIARRVFGVKDPGILSAIKNHTIGAPGMGVLSKIIYISDAVALDRRHPAVTRLRRLAYRNIDAAILEVMANKLYYVVKKRKWLHPGAAAAWNAAVAADKNSL